MGFNVIPAHAGIQAFSILLDARLHGHDIIGSSPTNCALRRKPKGIAQFGFCRVEIGFEGPDATPLRRFSAAIPPHVRKNNPS